MGGGNSNKNSDIWKEASDSFLANLTAIESNLQSLWEKIGLDESLVTKRVGRVFAILNEVLDEMVHEESTLLNTLQKRVHNYLRQIKTLSTELNCPNNSSQAPNNLLYHEKELRELLHSLETQKKNAISEWKKVDDFRKLTSARLGIAAEERSFIGVPSRSQMTALVQCTNDLENELKARQAKFLVLKNEIQEIINLMERPVNEEILNLALDQNSENKFILSINNFSELSRLKDTLDSEFSEIKLVIDRLWDSVNFLWKLLDISHEYSNLFQRKNINYTVKVRNSLQAEEERLRKLRLEKLSAYIPKLKEELTILWNKCRYGQQKREQFLRVFKDKISEESLSAHEEALLAASIFYKDNANIFYYLEKWDNAWEAHRKLELGVDSAEKYRNRGGILLKEEKLRKALYRELPKLENEVLSCAEKWEKKNGCPFYVDDIKLSEYVDLQKESLKHEKEERRRARLMRTPNNTPCKQLNGTMSATRLNSTMNRSRLVCTERCPRVRKNEPIVPLTPIKRRSSFKWPTDTLFLSPKINKQSEQITLKDSANILQPSNNKNISPPGVAIVSPIMLKSSKENDSPKNKTFSPAFRQVN